MYLHRQNKFALVFLGCLALSVTPLIAGCAKEDDGESAPEKPKIAFEGKPDPALVGFWKQDTRDASYNIKADGTFDYKGKVATPGGTIDASFSAPWLVNGDLVLFKDQLGNVSQYKYKIEGDKLTLSRTGSIKLDTVFHKK